MTTEDVGTTHVMGLLPVREPLRIWDVDSPFLAKNWSVEESSLTVKDGQPFGWIRYFNSTHSETALVAVRWNYQQGQLECRLTDPTRQGPANEIERDARIRSSSLLMAYAQIGAEVARHNRARQSLLRSAGLASEAQGS